MPTYASPGVPGLEGRRNGERLGFVTMCSRRVTVHKFERRSELVPPSVKRTRVAPSSPSRLPQGMPRPAEGSYPALTVSLCRLRRGLRLRHGLRLPSASRLGVPDGQVF